jgi:hypothetical protein
MVLISLPKSKISFCIDGSLVDSSRHGDVDKLTAINTAYIKAEIILKASSDRSIIQKSADPSYIPQKNAIF